ncbi:hypothetical protein V8E52_007377 [Russula decolorans]|jgi:hypothetical protein
MARIQSVAYHQIRSKSLITDHTTSDFDRRERLPVLLSTVIDGVAVVKVGKSSEVEVREQWSSYDDALTAMNGGYPSHVDLPSSMLHLFLFLTHLTLPVDEELVPAAAA